jgi:ATP-dependent helicase HrpB
MVAFQHLPLYQSLDLISSKFEEHQNLILTSPTGSGKSILIPYLASQQCKGRVVVLEPRKIAAQSLAEYLSSLLKEPCGETVGYQFHLENCKSSKTRILFQTYGSFLQELLHGEPLADFIIFDEFHERRAEMDLLMTFFRKIQELKKENAPRLIVLSAKIAVSEIELILHTSCLELHTSSFPVQILYQKKSLSSEENIVQALRTLQRNELWQTTLVFLPGKYEITRARQAIEESFGYQSIEILELFSGQTKEELKRLFTPSDSPRIILSTNVAETSLTIPNISAVIDSGLERFSEFDESEGVSTLRLSRISLQNALQRTGRAGRTQAGVCIRLWQATEEVSFSPEIVPEVQKMALHEILLQQAFLAHRLGLSSTEMGWISAPKTSLYQQAKQTLESLSFFKDDQITELGQKALSVPLLSVSLSAFVLSAKTLSDFTLRVIAWIDSSTEFLQRQKKAFNLEELATDSSMPKEVQFSYQRLKEYSQKEKKYSSVSKKEETALILFHFFKEQLAIQSGNAYKTQNERLLQINEAIQKNIGALIPFALWRTENKQKSELRAALYYPIASDLLKSNQNQVKYELLWRTKQSRFICIEIQKKDSIEISRKEILPQETSAEVQNELKEKVTKTWLEKLERENLQHLYENDETKTWLCKMKLAAEYFPEYSLPLWNEEDFLLVQEELVSGVFLERDITPEKYLKILKDYFGHEMIPWLSKTFPDHFIFENGKRAKYIYQNDLVEISARIGDFMGMQGKHFIGDGKIPVRYDILAPNYRTVQKTWDLSQFWEKTYPEIRKELRGRYPKHPWPETIR